MSNRDDEWVTTTGLPLDGADAEIIESSFGPNAEIGLDVVCWNVTFKDLETDEEVEQSFSVGKAGKPSRDGSELVGTGGFSSRSNYGRIINCAKALVDHPGDVIGSPRQAEGWLGTRWSLGTIQVKGRTDPQTGEPMDDRDVLVLTAYLGKGEDDEKPKKATRTAKKATKATGGAKKAAPATKTSRRARAKEEEPEEPEEAEAEDEDEGDYPDPPKGVDEDLWHLLIDEARSDEHDSDDSFIDAVLEWEDVDESRAAQRVILGGEVWEAAGRE